MSSRFSAKRSSSPSERSCLSKSSFHSLIISSRLGTVSQIPRAGAMARRRLLPTLLDPSAHNRHGRIWPCNAQSSFLRDPLFFRKNLLFGSMMGTMASLRAQTRPSLLGWLLRDRKNGRKRNPFLASFSLVRDFLLIFGLDGPWSSRTCCKRRPPEQPHHEHRSFFQSIVAPRHHRLARRRLLAF